ncbi:MAG: hypothetical protein ACLQVA_14775 [Candidatus Brocadiia bacterium]|jgi:hypothetical protein
MSRFLVKLRCTSCAHKFKRIMSAEDELHLAELPDPPCPRCGVIQHKRGMDVGGGKAPAVGGSLAVRAVDETARIVMEDHGMTDLRSDVREGESMAPKLPPKQQALADNFFAPPKSRRSAAGGIFSLPPAAVLKAAVGGRFMTPDTVVPMASQRASDRPAVNVIAASDRNGRPIKPA